jgi:hypothetical protein
MRVVRLDLRFVPYNMLMLLLCLLKVMNLKPFMDKTCGIVSSAFKTWMYGATLTETIYLRIISDVNRYNGARYGTNTK